MHRPIFRTFAPALAGTLLLAGLANADPADTPPSSTAANAAKIEGESIKALLGAMQQGDADSALGRYQSSTDPMVRAWAAMVIERIHFNLDDASAHARICEDALIDKQPGIALLCGQFRSGNLRLAGRRAEANDVERELVARFQGHRVDKQLAQMQSFLANEEATAPALAYDIPAGDVTIPLEESWQPKFNAKANGHAFDLELDTGAGDLVLSEDMATKFGVHLFDKKTQVDGWLSQGVDGQYGVLDELTFSGITLRNVPVLVVHRADSIALIGGNLVAPLGTLRIGLKGDAAITVYADGSKNAPACDTPMRVGTNIWGSTLRLYPQLLVEDEPQPLMLDTGAGKYLLGSEKALDNVTVLHRKKQMMGDIGGVHAFANAQRAKVKLTISGQPFDVHFDVLTDSGVGAQSNGLTLGAGALRDMDFLLDFRHQSQCFLLHPGLH